MTAVFTTINPPTDAIAQWAKQADCIVVGDRKTPAWEWPSCRFIRASEQSGRFARSLPWNHYARKMLGYVEAIRLGADRILDVDDDTWPTHGSFPAFEGEFETAWNDHGFLNIHPVFGAAGWPRGFPLRLIHAHSPWHGSPKTARIGVWQGLIEGDPDVDAIYRLTRAVSPEFVRRSPVVLPKGVACPFNSQHTLWRKELFPLMYLPTTVTFRFTDILRSLVAQPIMWAMGYQLGFTSPHAVQRRNPHDLMADFFDEVPMYLQTESALATCRAAIDSDADVITNLRKSYTALAKAGVVSETELPVLAAWLAEL